MTKDMIVKAAQEAAARRNEVFALNDLRVDLTARRVWKNGKPVRLTPREYALLEMLIRKRDLADPRRTADHGLGLRVCGCQPHGGCTYQPSAHQAGPG